jgi:hypothetical protein
MLGRIQSPHSTADGELSLRRIPILWHRRGTRRKQRKPTGIQGYPRINLGFTVQAPVGEPGLQRRGAIGKPGKQNQE